MFTIWQTNLTSWTIYDVFRLFLRFCIFILRFYHVILPQRRPWKYIKKISQVLPCHTFVSSFNRQSNLVDNLKTLIISQRELKEINIPRGNPYNSVNNLFRTPYPWPYYINDKCLVYFENTLVYFVHCENKQCAVWVHDPHCVFCNGECVSHTYSDYNEPYIVLHYCQFNLPQQVV